MTEELKEIQRSLQKDAGLPELPDLSVPIRTLETVKDEVVKLCGQVDEVASSTVYLQGLIERLTARLNRLEEVEDKLIAETLRELEKA